MTSFSYLDTTKQELLSINIDKYSSLPLLKNESIEILNAIGDISKYNGKLEFAIAQIRNSENPDITLMKVMQSFMFRLVEACEIGFDTREIEDVNLKKFMEDNLRTYISYNKFLIREIQVQYKKDFNLEKLHILRKDFDGVKADIEDTPLPSDPFVSLAK